MTVSGVLIRRSVEYSTGRIDVLAKQYAGMFARRIRLKPLALEPMLAARTNDHFCYVEQSRPFEAAPGAADAPPREITDSPVRVTRTDVPRDASTDAAARAARLAIAGELVAAITHDLRQPLTAIEMNVAAALRRLDPATGDEPLGPAAARIQAAADALRDALAEQRRMRESLQVLQDLAARREPAFTSVDLGESVREVVRLVGSEASARHARLEVTIAPTIPKVAADGALVRQALLNIVLDALDATTEGAPPGGAGPITVSVRVPTPGWVEVSVTHIGIRADASDGWGLALARSVADAHGASLAVSGDAARGQTVTSLWPVRHETDRASIEEVRRADG
jgi:signal transduction histidine kinase